MVAIWRIWSTTQQHNTRASQCVCVFPLTLWLHSTEIERVWVYFQNDSHALRCMTFVFLVNWTRNIVLKLDMLLATLIGWHFLRCITQYTLLLGILDFFENAGNISKSLKFLQVALNYDGMFIGTIKAAQKRSLVCRSSLIKHQSNWKNKINKNPLKPKSGKKLTKHRMNCGTSLQVAF